MHLGRGRQPKDRTILEVGPLTREDLARLEAPRKLPSIQRFRDSHHHLARLVAAGFRVQECADRSGYAVNTIHTFIRDPAFKEIVAQYRGQVNASFMQELDDYHDLLLRNRMKAERQLADKLEEAEALGETLPTRELIAIGRDAADRTGKGKHTTNVNVNIDFAAQLEARLKRRGQVLDLTPKSGGVSRAIGASPARAHSEPVPHTLPAPLPPSSSMPPTRVGKLGPVRPNSAGPIFRRVV